MDMDIKSRTVKSAMLSLLLDAYQRRDRVSLVVYRGKEAELVVPFTGDVESAFRHLKEIPYGGTTPLASGIKLGIEILLKETIKTPEVVPIMVIITDGTANVPLTIGMNPYEEIAQLCEFIKKKTPIRTFVIDVGMKRSKIGETISSRTNGCYYHPQEMAVDSILRMIQS